MAHLINKGTQSSTIKSYMSAIKRILQDDGYQWTDDRVLFASMTRACKLINDKVRTRLPISSGLLDLILFEIQRFFTAKKQFYLEFLYKSLFILGYYGLMRIGELTASEHVLKAKDLHTGTNKQKILMILHSSKTHSRANLPQKIKITANNNKTNMYVQNRNFCPFAMVNRFAEMRGNYKSQDEQFFIFKDGTPVKGADAMKMLRSMIDNLGLQSQLYGFHSLRIGRSSEMLNKLHFSLNEVKRLGRWRSSCVFKYIRN